MNSSETFPGALSEKPARRIRLKKTFNESLLVERLGLIILMGFLVVPYRLFHDPGAGLDQSWVLGLGLAARYGLEFGTDVIFTYGPLGYLITGLPDYHGFWPIVVFRLFIIANGLYLVYYVWQNSQTMVSKILWIFTVAFVPFLFSNYSDLVLYFLFLFHSLHYLRHKGFINLVLMSVIAAFSLYIKLNVGVISNFLFVVSIIYFFLDKVGNRMQNLAALSLYTGLHILLASTLHVSLVNYVANGLQIINHYNDAMSHLPSPGVLGIGLLVMALFVGLMIREFRNADQPEPVDDFNDKKSQSIKQISQLKQIWRTPGKRKMLFIVFQVALFAFVSFKYAFVRGDSGHYVAYFLSMPYLAFTFFLFTGKTPANTGILKLIAAIVVLTALVKLEQGRFANNFVNIAKNAFRYEQIRRPIYAENYAKVKLPDRMIREIGSRTVDIFPSEVSIAFFNNLVYNPRPVIQSYSAYSASLAAQNYHKYMSDSAPAYVVYHTGDIIDNHSPLWDDQHCIFALMQGYRMIDTATIDQKRVLLFKQQPVARKLSHRLVLDTVLELNKSFLMPVTDKMLFMESDLDYSLPGKLMRLIYQPSVVRVEFLDDKDAKTAFRIPMPLFKSGVVVNKSVHIDTTGRKDADFNLMRDFFKYSGVGGKQFASMRVTASGLWVQKKFRAKFWEYSLEEPAAMSLNTTADQ